MPWHPEVGAEKGPARKPGTALLQVEGPPGTPGTVMLGSEESGVLLGARSDLLSQRLVTSEARAPTIENSSKTKRALS